MWEGALAFGVQNLHMSCKFERLRFGCACLCPLLGLGWESTGVIRNRHEHCSQGAKGEGSGLSTAPPLSCSPNLFHTKSQPGTRTAAPCLLISVPGALFSQQLHSSVHKCDPSTERVTQKPPSSTPSLPFHLVAHWGLLQGSKGRVRVLGFV